MCTRFGSIYEIVRRTTVPIQLAPDSASGLRVIRCRYQYFMITGEVNEFPSSNYIRTARINFSFFINIPLTYTNLIAGMYRV